MIKQFLLLILFLVFVVSGIATHYVTYDNTTQKEKLSAIASITKLSSPSLSVAYYEPRILLHEVAQNPAYPQMQTMNRMDLVYAE